MKNERSLQVNKHKEHLTRMSVLQQKFPMMMDIYCIVENQVLHVKNVLRKISQNPLVFMLSCFRVYFMKINGSKNQVMEIPSVSLHMSIHKYEYLIYIPSHEIRPIDDRSIECVGHIDHEFLSKSVLGIFIHCMPRKGQSDLNLNGDIRTIKDT